MAAVHNWGISSVLPIGDVGTTVAVLVTGWATNFVPLPRIVPQLWAVTRRVPGRRTCRRVLVLGVRPLRNVGHWVSSAFGYVETSAGEYYKAQKHLL